MTPLFKKLNFKNFDKIAILNSPEEFENEMAAMAPFTDIVKQVSTDEMYNFILVFVKTDSEIIALTDQIKGRFAEDAVLWFSYPKQSSKKYKSTINRDKGWEYLGQFGFEPVRQVSIDTDWSALRFRNINNIKEFSRKFHVVTNDEAKAKIQMTEAFRENIKQIMLDEFIIEISENKLIIGDKKVVSMESTLAFADYLFRIAYSF